MWAAFISQPIQIFGLSRFFFEKVTWCPNLFLAVRGRQRTLFPAVDNLPTSRPDSPPLVYSSYPPPQGADEKFVPPFGSRPRSIGSLQQWIMFPCIYRGRHNFGGRHPITGRPPLIIYISLRCPTVHLRPSNP